MGGGADILLEREAELVAVERAVAAAESGDGGALLLEGPAGIGKTSLIQAAAARADQRGMVALTARGDELERSFSWGLAIQLFGPLAAAADNDDLFRGPAVLARRLFERGEAAPPLSPDPEPGPFPLLHGAHWLLANLSEREPVLLLLDDVQFADAESLRLCSYLLARLDGMRVSMLLGMRTGEPVGPEAEPLLERLRANPSLRALEIRPLSHETVTKLVREELPGADPAFADAFAETVAGNPFLCRELLSTIRADAVPPTSASLPFFRNVRAESIRRSILVRLGRLGDAATRLAAATAVLEAAAPLGILAELAELSDDEAVEALETLVAAGVIDPGEPLRFTHPIVRDVIRSDRSQARLRRDHTRAARLLADVGADPEEVANHLLAGERTRERWAVEALRRAAALNLSRGSPARAAEHLRAALGGAADGVGDRAELLLELGRAEMAAGEPAASEHIAEALELSREMSSAPLIAVTLGETLYASGRFGEAVKAFEQGIDLLERQPAEARDELVEARLLAGIDSAGRLGGKYPGRAAARVAALAAAGPPANPTPGQRVLMAMAAGEYALGVEMEVGEVVALAHAALADADPGADLGRAVIEPVLAALMFSDRLTEADAILERLVTRAAERGEASAWVSLITFRGYVALARGPLAHAVAYADEAIRLVAEAEAASRQALAPARHVLALASLERGDLDEALRAVDVAEPERLWGRSPLYGWFLDAVGRVELTRGDHDRALGAFTSAGEQFLAAGGEGVSCDWRSGAALAAHGTGDRLRAIELADEELELAGRFGSPRSIAIALRCRALVEEDPERSVGMLREAVRTAEASEALVERARCRVELGAALRRGGWDRASREPLRQGMEQARELGSIMLVERSARELEASGARRPRLALSGAESLTPSQRRVAEMAARGMTNAQIAAALFVTKRTVETHLTAAYAKLGIRSRAELAGIEGLSSAT